MKEQLGEPAHRLDFHWKNQKFSASEFVYTGKGISLSIIPETGVIASVQVFPPCAIEIYESRYYNSSPVREFQSDE